MENKIKIPNEKLKNLKSTLNKAASHAKYKFEKDRYYNNIKVRKLNKNIKQAGSNLGANIKNKSTTIANGAKQFADTSKKNINKIKKVGKFVTNPKKLAATAAIGAGVTAGAVLGTKALIHKMHGNIDASNAKKKAYDTKMGEYQATRDIKRLEDKEAKNKK